MRPLHQGSFLGLWAGGFHDFSYMPIRTSCGTADSNGMPRGPRCYKPLGLLVLSHHVERRNEKSHPRTSPGRPLTSAFALELPPLDTRLLIAPLRFDELNPAGEGTIEHWRCTHACIQPARMGRLPREVFGYRQHRRSSGLNQSQATCKVFVIDFFGSIFSTTKF